MSTKLTQPLFKGLERTDNGMKQSSWPEPPMINQKNYYTPFPRPPHPLLSRTILMSGFGRDYMKRDDQILPFRLQNEANREKMIRNAKDRDRALARTGNTDVPMPLNGDGELEDDEEGGNEGFDATKTIVIHPGSQNLRIGFASDALPKTIPMCIASKYPATESEEYESRPKRQKLDGSAEELFGEEFSKKFKKMSEELKVDMRANKRKVLPNSKELVINYNRRTAPEEIPEHNDPLRIEWTDVTSDDPKDNSTSYVGLEAQRIPDDSDPKYKLFWPIQNGWFHENDYTGKRPLFEDFDTIIEKALRKELGLTKSSEWEQYSCVFVIPDLYDKQYVEEALHICMKSIEFKQVCFIQESLAATFGAGYTSACIVDIGAQKTSICCVEDGMLIEDSRINLKYGGYDVTETFVKMMLHDSFHYENINLKRRYDFLLAEELKINTCTMNQAEISVQLYHCHLRAPKQSTRKYNYKTYDEVILAPMGFFDPSIFDNSDKLVGRRKWIDRSYNAYEGIDQPDDPTSSAQFAILTSIKPSLATAPGFHTNGYTNQDVSTPSKEKLNPFLSRMDIENGTSRVTSTAGSPAPEGSSTPVPSGPFVFGTNGTNGGSPGPSFAGQMFNLGSGSHNSGTPIPPAGMFVDPMARTQQDLASERDSVLPIAPLDTAIITSITHAAKGDDKKVRDFFGGIMVIGGGAKTPGFGAYLEERLKAKRPDLTEKILVGTSPREMDGQVVTWKGASIFARMTTNDSWIVQEVYEKLGSRAIQQKVLWYY
ncbi:putative actin-related 8 [Hyphodiscus hymeniophilus]|uniref:Actin-related 8 n=1 Tax=Hyphodiscus hymeniophilus TaxID=353542 RepID=A0A9P6VRU7_9HELO|nr:putative actin-related 8 [Hyphodiscus hymeniophilus]